MPKKKVAVSELVRETAGLVLSMLVVRNHQTAQLLMATGQSRLTLMRAIRYLRAKGVRIYWERGGRGYYMTEAAMKKYRSIERMRLGELGERNRGWAWCLGLEAA